MPPTHPSTNHPHAEIRPGIRLDARRAVWLAEPRLLVIADVHWGYAATHRARGNLLPDWGDEEIEHRLRSLVSDYAPVEMILIGDIVHAREGASRAEAFLREPPVPTVVLAGNHDRRWRPAAERVVRRGPFVFHHGDQDVPAEFGTLQFVGHLHPCLAWYDGAGGRAKLPALVDEGHRLILPAFSPWAAGVDCRDFTTAAASVWVITPKRIFAAPPRGATVAKT